MNVLAHLWDRVSGSQPLPPTWLVALTGIVAVVIVLNTRVWMWAGKVITIAHEGGHALVSVLSGRRLDGIRLHADSSGVTYSRGKRNGPGLVLTAAAGYLMPSLLGAGAAVLLASQHLTAMLWLALVLLAATFLAVRNVFGAVAVLVTAGAVFVISYYAPALVQAAFAYLAVWFLLFGGLRPVLELIRSRTASRGASYSRTASYSRGRPAGWNRAGGWNRGGRQYRYRSPAGISDADQLANLTGVPAGAWITLFTLVAVAALLLGASLLVPAAWQL